MSPKVPPAAGWTVLGLLKKASAYLKDRGVESPRASAEILLAHVLQLERIGLYLHYDQPVTAEEQARFRAAVLRRLKGEPVAYIVGVKEFWDLPFRVTPDVLIPRPETEHLVETALTWLSGQEKSNRSMLRVLDLGTGSGVLAVTLARHARRVSLFASDASFAAVRVARRNARDCGVDDRIRFVCGDWLLPFKAPACAFDAVVTNPPYVRSGEIPKLQQEIACEPRLALDGGADGLDAVRRILLEAHAFLRPGGVLMMEIGFDQKGAVEALAQSRPQYRTPRFVKDYKGRDRVVILEKE